MSGFFGRFLNGLKVIISDTEECQFVPIILSWCIFNQWLILLDQINYSIIVLGDMIHTHTLLDFVVCSNA